MLFLSCRASVFIGGCYAYYLSGVTVSRSTIDGCTARYFVGAYAFYSTLILSETTFINLKSDLFGGALASYGALGELRMVNSSIMGCTSSNGPCAVLWVRATARASFVDVRVVNCTSGSTSTEHGNIACYSGCALTLETVTFTQCSAVRGGAISSCGTTHLYNVTLIRCEAEELGGGIHLASGTLVMRGGSINACRSTATFSSGGGGISCELTGQVSLYGVRIQGCDATDAGGGVQVQGDGTLYLGLHADEPCVIESCFAGANGGESLRRLATPPAL